MKQPRLPPLRGLPLVHLHAGELACLRERRVVTTILGSCVSVTLFSARAGMAAICHAQFPEDPGAPPERRLYYADTAIGRMADFFREADVPWSEVEVKVFGGADMLDTGNGGGSVGRKNLEAALRALSACGLSPSASDVRGRQGRRLFFFTDNGEVLLRRLRKNKVVCE